MGAVGISSLVTLPPFACVGWGNRVQCVRSEQRGFVPYVQSYKNHQQGQYAPTPTAIYALQAAGPVRLVTVLHSTRRGEACPIGATVAGADVAATSIQLELADGTVVNLAEEDYFLDNGCVSGSV